MKSEVRRDVPCRLKFKYPNGAIKTGWVKAVTPMRYHKGAKGEGGDNASRVELLKFDDDE